MAKMNPKGHKKNAKGYCNQPYHIGDLTFEMLYENQCIEKKCRRLAIIKEKFQKRVNAYRCGELSREDFYGHLIRKEISG